MPDQGGHGVAPAPDPRGVRITVLGVEDLEDVAAATFEPRAEPLEMTMPSTGVGLLGGVTTTPAATQRSRVLPSLAQDGRPIDATLEHRDPTHAIVGVAPHAPTAAVLFLPADAAEHGRTGVRRFEVVVDGWRFDVEAEPAARAALRERARRGREEAGRSGPTEVHAIIPGVVVSVSVSAGDEVTAGQQLLVVEAMKMQNELRAPRDGTIERVATSQGATIEVGDLLLVIA